MIILLLLSLALAADTGDTACDGIDVPTADASCHSPDVANFCSESFGGACPTWTEVSAWAPPGGGTLALDDCGPEGTLTHLATESTNEWGMSLGFDGAGTLVWASQWRDNGDPWCCDGTESYSIEWGATATCSPLAADTAGNLDTGANTKPPVCGCSTGARRPISLFAALMLALSMLRGREERPRRR